jgi:sensor histidine kinase YesM
MNPDQLERIKHGETTPRLTGSGYGTKNVAKRIQHYFGDSYGLTYKSVRGEGTAVDIHIPVSHEVD